ncbi:hypothetical protein ACFXHK_10225 [Embleya sp. NPDC059267]|uniref:hypothetical protein n=1 Tax=Embleya sp. NPDC059267 TaxID=3346798 RepID=UPI00369697FE
MSYRVQYANAAEAALAKLSDSRRREIVTTADATIGRDPYGQGSCAIRGDRDRREVTIARAFVTYEVSPNVVVVTVMQVTAPFG